MPTPASSYVASLFAKGRPKIAASLARKRSKRSSRPLRGQGRFGGRGPADTVFHLMVFWPTRMLPLRDVLARTRSPRRHLRHRGEGGAGKLASRPHRPQTLSAYPGASAHAGLAGFPGAAASASVVGQAPRRRRPVRRPAVRSSHNRRGAHSRRSLPAGNWAPARERPRRP